MKTVYKYSVSVDTVLMMPVGAKILHCDSQGSEKCLWVEVDNESPLEERRFAAIGTGHAVPPGGVHVGTGLVGPFVWHLYELN